jgi:Domain of unknown function (DUF5666)
MNIRTSSQTLRSAAAAAVLLLSIAFAAAQDVGTEARPAPRIGAMTRHGLAGVVTSIRASAIVMEIPENVSFTVQFSLSTIVTGHGDPFAIADLHRGDPILVNGDIDEQARTIQAHAITIQAPFAATILEHQRADFGKTWTAGIVTAVQGNAITVARRDGQSQTFAVDEGTAWRLHDQQGSSAMIRVGESIRVQLRPGATLASQVSIQGMTRPN